MLMKMYTILDHLADEAGPPFIAKNDNVARRQFENLIVETFRGSPQPREGEYSLFAIGTFDTTTVELTRFDVPLVIPTDLARNVISKSFEDKING